MKKLYKRSVYALLAMCLVLLYSGQMSLNAQCANNNTFYLDLTTTFDGDVASASCIFGGEYCTASVCSGVTYIISTCGATFDTQITLYTSTGLYLDYSDDDCGSASELIWTSTYDGTVYIVVDRYNCQDDIVCSPISVTQIGECTALGACPNDNALWNVNATPSGVGSANAVNLECMFGGEYLNVSVCQGATYTFSSCAATYDTQFTLYQPNGTFLDYDDDGCGANSGSFLSWTAPFSGTVELHMDQYQCLSNSTCTPINITQTTACTGGCSFVDVDAFFEGCSGEFEVVTFYPYFTGSCFVEGMWLFETTSAEWQYVDLSTEFFQSGEAIGINLPVDNTTYTYYFVLDNNSVSLDYFYNTGNCSVASCGNFSSFFDYLGCDGTVETVAFTPVFTGGCTVEGVWFYTDLVGWTYLDLSAQGIASGDPVEFFLPEDNTTYIYYYVLDDASESQNFSYTTGTCDVVSCSFFGADNSFIDCVDTDELVNFYAYYSGDCSVSSIWFYTTTGGWQETVLASNMFYSGDPIGIYLFLDNTFYDFYFELSDGTLSDTYSYLTSNCDDAFLCSNLFIDYTDLGCFNTGAGQVPSGNITPFYNGACLVAGVYTSVNGAAYQYLDLSAFNYGSGDDMGLLFNILNADYDVYYVLDDGSISPIVSFSTTTCESGETICDCMGTQIPIEALAWLGDGSLDDGTYFWNDDPNLPVNFDCALWGFDCGDEIEFPNFAYDPYGVCSGSIPPANGCVDEFCYNVDLDLTTDCFPNEVSVYVINSNGDLVFLADAENFIIDEYMNYTFPMCLPQGCYTFILADSFGDGMSSEDCISDGFAGIFDYSAGEYTVFVNGSEYADEIAFEFCVGPQTVCDNLELIFFEEPCYPSGVGTELLPSIGYTFDFAGSCDVESVFYSVNGGEFVELNVSADNYGSGDDAGLYFLEPNSDYTIYYTTDDGAVSFLYDFSTANCNDEITVCDCNGSVLSIGVLSWLGDGFADNGFYQWAGQDVDFNCITWGFDCGDIEGAPNIDPYGICEGGLPPSNGCINTTEILGCTDPMAINFNPQATVNDGSCIYNLQIGCTDPQACNYNDLAVVDNGSCEYVTCAGCTDEEATNYDPTATIDDGSCFYTNIPGCTDPDAYNYNPIATADDGSCVYECVWPGVFYDDYCSQNDLNNFYIDVEVSSLGNGAPYTITNSFNNQQQVMSITGSFTMGPFPNGTLVALQVSSNTLENCFLTSQIISLDCSIGGVYGCTDPEALNYNPAATIDDGSCEYPGVNEVEVQNFTMYPNPARDQVMLSNNGGQQQVQLRILDNTGRIVLNEQHIIGKGQMKSLNIAHLAQGNYVLEITGNDSLEHHSLIIQK
jgi:hypothetical protein